MNTKPKFNIGDVVRLNSGGPSMTVVRDISTSHTLFETAWFDDKNAAQSSVFPSEALTVLLRST